MASTVYETLKEVEKGRQNCIKKAKMANLPATDNMNIFNLGELFLLQNNTEYINPNNPEQGGGWHRPSDWWDCKSILENAEIKDGLYPAYILLLPDISDTTRFAKTAVANATLQGDGYLTSDGSWYVSTDVTHTWDTTQDKECSEGYKTRYVIVYVANKTSLKNSKIDISKFPCLECILGDIEIHPNSSYGIFVGGSSSASANSIIRNFECLDSTIYSTIGNSYAFAYCSSLTNISLPSLTTISNGSTFQYCRSLTNISLPNLTTISNSGTFQYCSSLTNISLPNLTTLSGGSTFENCHSLTNISLPNLTTISNNNTFTNCFSLKELTLPSLTTIIKSSTFASCSSLKNISLPSLTTISDGFTFSACYSLKELTLPSTLATLVTTNTFQYCSSLMTLNLFNGFNFSGLNLSQCTNMRVESLRDIIDKLADVSSESDTYTLILGSTNIAKLTTAEIAIATNKGWTVS